MLGQLIDRTNQLSSFRRSASVINEVSVETVDGSCETVRFDNERATPERGSPHLREPVELVSARGLKQLERTLARHLPLGAHLVTPRLGYLHHGIYAGANTVIHYAGVVRHFWSGLVEETSLDRFVASHGVAIAVYPAPRFSADEIVRRAYSRLGENRYNLLTNNCEHFCAWCLVGANYSEQVERWRRLRALSGVAGLLGRTWG